MEKSERFQSDKNSSLISLRLNIFSPKWPSWGPPTFSDCGANKPSCTIAMYVTLSLPHLGLGQVSPVGMVKTCMMAGGEMRRE